MFIIVFFVAILVAYNFGIKGLMILLFLFLFTVLIDLVYIQHQINIGN
jgi:hypothetical protein